jgi:ABC-2 type transport system permease protein
MVTMRAYAAVMGARVRALIQYRAAALAGVATQVFWGFVRVMILEAFYRSTTAPQPMDFAQVAAYVWLGQALLATLPWNFDAEVRAMVRSGAVAYELLRPADLYGLWYARGLALRTAPAMLRVLPILLFAGLVLPAVGLSEWALHPPPSVAAGVAFAASMLAAVLLSASITTLLNVTLLWTLGADGVAAIIIAAVTVFGGLVIPLPLFPDWTQPILSALPFAGLMDTPFRLYTGDHSVTALPRLLAHQLGWTIAIALVGRALLSRGMRRIVIQGG